MTGKTPPINYVPPETLWRDIYRRRRRLQAALWVGSSVAAFVLGALVSSTAAVIAAAIIGGLLGIAVPWVGSWLSGAEWRRAARVLSWHRRRFGTPIDRMLAAGNVDAARQAIARLEAHDPWGRFEMARLRSRLASATGSESPVSLETRQAAASLIGLDRIRADAEIIVLEAAGLASTGGDWNGFLAAADLLVRRDRSPSRMRLFGLTFMTLLSSTVVASGAAVLAGIALVFGLHA